jgi:hypothetical protein
MIPTNEQGVIIEFAKCAERYGYEILSIQESYPDAIVRRNGVEYRTEFEFSASNFRQHKHDVRECDLVICWENDLHDFALPVLALADTDWGTIDIRLPSDIEREAAYWKQRALAAEAQLKQIATQREESSQRLRGSTTIDLRSAVLATYKANPKATHQEIATLIGISRQRVGQLLAEVDLSDLPDQPADKRQLLAAHFAQNPDSTNAEASRLLGIPASTVRIWRQELEPSGNGNGRH